jgi:hypothetical protein
VLEQDPRVLATRAVTAATSTRARTIGQSAGATLSTTRSREPFELANELFELLVARPVLAKRRAFRLPACLLNRA